MHTSIEHSQVFTKPVKLSSHWIYRASESRGMTQLSWLESKHTFSFGSYHDPAWHQFSGLRVINEDIVAPQQGFGWHGHQHMEIVTYVCQGTLEHQDSLGNTGVLHKGSWQYMHAGKGIEHREWNPDPEQPSHFLQLWLYPQDKEAHTTPHYQDDLPAHAWLETDQLTLKAVLSGSGVAATQMHHQGAVGTLVVSPGSSVSLTKVHEAFQQHLKGLDITPSRLWLQTVQGHAELMLQVPETFEEATCTLKAGDGLGLPLADLAHLTLQTGETGGEWLWFALL